MAKNRRENYRWKVIALNLLPPTIRKSIILDPVLRRKKGLVSDAVVTFIDSATSFQRPVLFEAIRSAYVKVNRLVTVTGEDGKEWKLSINRINNINYVRVERGEQIYLLKEFWLLNPHVNERIETFEKVAQNCNFSSDIKEQWRNIISEKLVSDDDFSELSKEIAESPFFIIEKLKSEMRENLVQISTLIPTTEKYYESLVGKYQGSSDIYEYTQLEISELTNRLFLGDRHLALISLLIISSHSSVISCLKNFDIDFLELEIIYDWLVDFGDPFSCVASIEFGFSILHKYPALEWRIEKIIAKILDDVIRKEYKLLVSLIMLVDGELARLQLFKGRPPFYRRLASIAQASLITRCAIEINVDFSSLEKWAHAQRDMVFYCQSLIDLRLEPRWLPDYLTPEQLRAELLGRIYNVSQQYVSSITSDNLRNLLLKDKENSLLKDIGINAFLPGPLEGNIKQNDMPSDIFKIIEAGLSEGIPTPKSFTALINSIHYWEVDSCLAELVLKILTGAKHQLNQTKSQDQLRSILNGLARAASTVKSTDLAMSLLILTRKYREYLSANSHPENLMVIGLISAASFGDLEGWANYVGNWLNELTYLPLDSDAAKRLYKWVKQLCILEPLLYCTAGSALAILDSLNL